GVEHVIRYVSRMTTKRERESYAATHLELAGVIFVIYKLSEFLCDITFTLRVDHHALCWLFSMKGVNSKFSRWSTLVQDFQFSVEYIEGRKFCDVDCISRLYENEHVTVNVIQMADLIEA